MRSLLIQSLLLFALAASVSAQTPNDPEKQDKQSTANTQDEPGIQDNSFLVEEAYNQEYGIVQHIQTFQRFWPSGDWIYTFTQEWPVDPAPKNQLSYTIPVVNASSNTGIGDVALNYRYQLIGNGQAKYAMAPRFTVLVPTGDYKAGLGAGGVGLQGGIPLTVVHNKWLTTNWNIGTTITPVQKNMAGQTATTFGVNAGQSFIWTMKKRVNLLLETVWVSTEQVVANGKTERENALLVSPGVRWAYNLKNGTQIVPGIAAPIGAGPSGGDWGILIYFSIEHPFTKLKKK